jgi:hypothetical protein
MGNYFSKLIDYENELQITFDIYPSINYEKSSNNNNNLLEQNILFKKYIKKKIQRSIYKISDIQTKILENKFKINCNVNLTENKIYYQISIYINFIMPTHYTSTKNENNNNIKMITYNLLEKTIIDRFSVDIDKKINIKIDKTNFIYLDVGSIRNIKIY